MDYLYHGDTDTDGQYLVENIPPGSYDFYLGLRSGPPVSRTLTIRPGETTTADFLVQLGGMSGTVHTPSGEPLAGATVTLYPGGLKVTTDQQGTFSFADLTPNYYDVEVTGQGLCTARYGMFVPYGDPSIIDLTVNRYASVSGTIRDKMGLPLSGVAVYLYMWANAVTDSSGRYEMTNVEPPGGPLGITATKSGYGTAERNILISEGQATICDFTMGNLLTLGQVGTCLIPGNPQSIKLRGNLAYLACGSAGLRIVDVSNPALPVI
jgi:hypothetical protein